VYFYDPERSCFPQHDLKSQNLIDSHYEKITKNANKYFFVNGDKPSGFKGAIVVSSKEAENLEDE